MKKFADLTQGTVIRFERCTTADETDFVVLNQFNDKFGNWTEVLNLETYEKDEFSQHTKIGIFWTIVKEN